MGRKRQWLDDDDSSEGGSSGSDGEGGNWNDDPDTRDERELFADPYKRKKQRRNGKEDAYLGVFAEDDEEEDYRNAPAGKKPRYTKPVAFVSGESKKSSAKDDAVADSDGEDDELEIAEEAEEDSSIDEEDEELDESPQSPRVITEDQDEDPSANADVSMTGQEVEMPRPRGFGIGAKSSRGGIGSGGGGMGMGTAKKAASMFAHFGAPVMQASNAPTAGGGTPTPNAGTPLGGTGSNTPEPESSEPKRGGIGSSSTSAPSNAAAAFATPVRGGIGSSSRSQNTSLPTSFGGSSSAPQEQRAQRSFVREEPKVTPVAMATHLSAEEKKHFASIADSGSFGAKMMAKMGWQAGQGLGATQQGIVTPIEVKLRPKTAGIAYKGFKERTAQSKAEAKRRGEKVSSDEEDAPAKGRKGKKDVRKQQEDRSNAWKNAPRKSKAAKVTHMTYEEILAQADEMVPRNAGLGQIIDATGATPREVASLADISSASWIPSLEAERIPEIRHNLRLLVASAKSDLDGLAREAKALEERRKWVKDEDARLKRIVDDETRAITRLQQISKIVEDVNAKTKQLASSYDVTLDIFTADFDKLSLEYSVEYDQYALDEVVVGAIAPYVRRRLAQWNPLKDPNLLTAEFKKWRRLLRISKSHDPSTALIERHNVHSSSPPSSPRMKGVPTRGSEMTPYESLMWNVWLPRMRSVINNEWSPSEPQSLTHVFDVWTDLIPPFIFDNVMDQLVMPKLLKSVSDWTMKDDAPLHVLVLPWLPIVGLRMDTLLDDAKRKLKSMMRSWSVAVGVPDGLIVWKDVLKPKEWDDLLLKYVVPKLGASLREDFQIDPANQDMKPLERVKPWAAIIKPAIYSQLIEIEFFPKWLNTLHAWLSQPSADFEEVAQWYLFWKSSFSETILEMPGVTEGFTRGLQLMNKASELGSDSHKRLPKPDTNFDKFHRPDRVPALPAATSKSKLAAPDEEVSFRTLIEEYVGEHNLLFLPLNRAHHITRLPLFRIAQNIDGRGGVTVYILDDVVWAIPSTPGAREEDAFKPIGLDDLVVRATKGKQ